MLFSRAIALSILAFLLGTKCLHPWGILSSILVFYMTNVVVILYIQNPSPLNKENMLTKILIPVTTFLSSLLSVCLYLGMTSQIRCLVFHSLVSFLSFTSLHTKILSNGAYFSKSHYYCIDSTVLHLLQLDFEICLQGPWFSAWSSAHGATWRW